MSESKESLETRVISAGAPGAIELGALALARGELVVFPTDTVYGVGCDYRQRQAIDLLYWAKQRPYEMPIPVLVSSLSHVQQVAQTLSDSFEALAERYWPGGLTLIVPRAPALPDLLTAGGDTVAVRMPDHPIALALIEAAGGAVAATSANRSGQPSPVTAADALADLNGRVHLVLDGGTCPQGVASSIIDISVAPPRLLRLGPLDQETLREALPDLTVPE